MLQHNWLANWTKLNVKLLYTITRTHTLVVEIYIVMTTFEQNLVSSTKDKYLNTLWHSNSTPKFIPNRNVGPFVPRDVHKYVHNSQNVENLNFHKVHKMWYIHPKEYSTAMKRNYHYV